MRTTLSAPVHTWLLFQVLDGGEMKYYGDATQDEYLTMNINGPFTVNGGGVVSANKIVLTAHNITVDTDGVFDSDGLGYPPGTGRGVGRTPLSGDGGSGGM